MLRCFRPLVDYWVPTHPQCAIPPHSPPPCISLSSLLPLVGCAPLIRSSPFPRPPCTTPSSLRPPLQEVDFETVEGGEYLLKYFDPTAAVDGNGRRPWRIACSSNSSGDYNMLIVDTRIVKVRHAQQGGGCFSS